MAKPVIRIKDPAINTGVKKGVRSVFVIGRNLYTLKAFPLIAISDSCKIIFCDAAEHKSLKPVEHYEQLVSAGQIKDDPDQRKVLDALEHLHDQIQGYKPKSKWLMSGLFGVVPPRPKGLYIYGGVGRGKSMLMDLFFETAPTAPKRRVHFHAFMQEVHDGMHEARKSGVSDALKPVAEKIVKSASLLCFDEMQISDITDAMIVGRLFQYLFDAGVIIVTTSNRHPDELYKDGLNRALFLPFIDLIKERLVLHNLNSETDHRQGRLEDRKLYFSPLSNETEDKIDALWHDLSGGDAEPLVLRRKGRNIVLPLFRNGVGRAGFAELCDTALGPGDYLEIAKAVRVLVLTDIPKLSRARNNEAKRFVTLIDALYEAKVRLIASAAAPPEQLYTVGPGAFEFERTASRLREMQSAGWGRD